MATHAAMAVPHLITITFSHYCEKARWALEHLRIPFRESGHLPVFHAFAVKRAGGVRSTPILVTNEGVLTDSTDILHWADKQAPEAHLYGKNESERREIEALEDYFDEELGPHTRRWMYFHVLPHRKLILQFANQGEPAAERALLPVFYPVARAIMRRAMRIDQKGYEKSFKKIEAVFAEVEKKMADGRAFFVGDSLSAADITFATLAAVVLLPPEYHGKLPSLDELPPEAATQMRAWQERPAGKLALRLFRDHRRA